MASTAHVRETNDLNTPTLSITVHFPFSHIGLSDFPTSSASAPLLLPRRLPLLLLPRRPCSSSPLSLHGSVATLVCLCGAGPRAGAGRARADREPAAARRSGAGRARADRAPVAARRGGRSPSLPYKRGLGTAAANCTSVPAMADASHPPPREPARVAGWPRVGRAERRGSGSGSPPLLLPRGGGSGAKLLPCSFRWAVTGPYPTKYVSNLRFPSPIRPSSQIRPGYISLAYPCRIRMGYAIRQQGHVSVFLSS